MKLITRVNTNFERQKSWSMSLDWCHCWSELTENSRHIDDFSFYSEGWCRIAWVFSIPLVRWEVVQRLQNLHDHLNEIHNKD